MKANIDGKGVAIQAESPEEAEILRQLWLRGPSAAAFTRHPNGYFDVVVVPLPEKPESQ